MGTLNGKTLVVGAGGVSHAAVHKMAMNSDIFTEITLASRTKSKCDAIAAAVKDRVGVEIKTAELDAYKVEDTVKLIKETGAEILVNLALPYQDLVLMDACLEAGIHYIDTANYEPEDEAKFEYHWQWAYQERFKAAGLTAILGSGFDPGVTSVFAKWLKKHKLDTIRQIDVLDANGGSNDQEFATNFNPEINLREVLAEVRHWEGGEWKTSPAMTHKVEFDFPAIGPKNMYLMYHEELESLSTHFPEIERARFWMTFGDAYITHAKVLENVGMTRIDPVMHDGKEIIPIQFLKTLLPDPGDLGAETKGKACIGDIATGQAKDGSGEKTFYIYNICDHEECYAEVGSQAVSYTTGVPAMIGAAQVLKGNWTEPGVWNMEQLDPDDFMDMLNTHGLPWQVHELDGPVTF
ncbi:MULTISPECIES: saccharopine dehydrogenase family protein [unclassified Ruegeria]|uniref:saccharopine dehydrogenase family protein n=1 Tax=unclassified Ruegeria TaxID=2625375 RepID=UPI001ADA2279|nr:MULTISPECIES: saccharopine dehydrogenase family protein [unclassified Ruegeria]MBO9411367.1 saccharopine dehydrogenase family protein [Ruegeria sp. R8_1]MBO9416071.1 saccharopine dehydrogenase family protein [Ruegeria sp. R8_2]